jgi:hypothetical protein
VVPAATQGRFDDGSWRVDLRLVDERHLDRLPQDATPILLLGALRRPAVEDPRVVGWTRRPAQVADLYPLLQRALERHPRAAPRIPVSLLARCTHAGRRFSAEVLTLSTQGCRLRAQSDLPSGLEVNLLFPLPLGRMISTRARVRESGSGEAGLAFVGLSSGARAALTDYVAQRLVRC